MVVWEGRVEAGRPAGLSSSPPVRKIYSRSILPGFRQLAQHHNIIIPTPVYLESVVFILEVFNAQSLGFNLLPEERGVHHLYCSCQGWRQTCRRENRRMVRDIQSLTLCVFFPNLEAIFVIPKI